MDETLILQLVGTFPEIRGKKVFQKLCYFLQEAEGARLGVRFRMKHYGPYSEELDAGLEDLAERQVVGVEGSGEDGFRISLSSRAPEELPELNEEDTAALEKLHQRFSGDLSHGLTLELLATLHFLSKDQPYGGTDADKERLIQQVRAWKGTKFEPRFIEQQIARLEAMGYLTPSAGD